MTQLLERAFSEATQLPPEAQDAVAEWLMGELESERRWDAAFARSAGSLALLADEALAEHRAGMPLVLDHERL